MDGSKIIAVVGLIGSGKTEATQRFIARGFTRFGYNDVIYEELERRGLERNEKNERMVREGLRKEFGMAVAALRKIPEIEAAVLRGENVVIESLYTWSEYKATKEKFKDSFKVLAVYAPPHVRYARLATRPVRPLTYEEAISRDYAEIENLEKGGAIAMADWTIPNVGTLEQFLYLIDKLIDGLIKPPRK
jgi:dephospho-CoA kinase